MIGLSAVFAHRLMAIQGKNTLVGIPEVAERVAPLASERNSPAELQTTGFAVVANEIGHNLSRATTQGYPNPPLIFFPQHKRPYFIEFPHVIHLGFIERIGQGRQLLRPVGQPPAHRASRQTKQTLKPSQADPFEHRSFHLCARVLPLARLGEQWAITLAVFAVIFLCTFVIVSVFHHVVTPAVRALVRYNGLYHEKVLRVNLAVCLGVPFHISSGRC